MNAELYEIIMIGFMVIALLIVWHHIRSTRRDKIRKEKYKWQ